MAEEHQGVKPFKIWCDCSNVSNIVGVTCLVFDIVGVTCLVFDIVGVECLVFDIVGATCLVFVVTQVPSFPTPLVISSHILLLVRGFLLRGFS